MIPNAFMARDSKNRLFLTKCKRFRKRIFLICIAPITPREYGMRVRVLGPAPPLLHCLRAPLTRNSREFESSRSLRLRKRHYGPEQKKKHRKIAIQSFTVP